ncbi:hypothetical protein PV10_03608 [Exophiala mesophila]|uniref:F-box domain-containing protein n=1 Tax=Exophiala mesophila TaxID=212818 RepID=A0A0D1Y5W9_EXOME|nr:uncharacterized protein PV10_03608 [Exophiala mesophila]KIV96026.1 hypothetical protein PV10_03608 [Exophiala mesophila]
MTLRRHERIHGDHEIDIFPAPRDNVQPDLTSPMRANTSHQLRNNPPQNPPPSSDLRPFNPLHPIFTDFGPQSLTNYLRSQVSSSKSEAAPSLSHRPDQQIYSSAFSSSDGPRTFIHGASLPLSNTSNNRTVICEYMQATSSLSSPVRRSSRLREKYRRVKEPTANPSTLDFSRSSGSSDVISDTEIVSPGPSERSNFEQYTRSRRKVGRVVNTALEGLSSSRDPIAGINELHRPRKEPSKRIPHQHVHPPNDVPDEDSPSHDHGVQPSSSLIQANLTTLINDLDQPCSNNPQEEVLHQDLGSPALSDTSLHSAEQPDSQGHELKPTHAPELIFPYPYHHIVPELFPRSILTSFLSDPRTVQTGPSAKFTENSPGDDARNNAPWRKKSLPLFPRSLPPSSTIAPTQFHLSVLSGDPSDYHDRPARIMLDAFSTDLWIVVASYLCTNDIKNLRLTCKSIATSLAEVQLRNVVVNFGESFFRGARTSHDTKDAVLPPDSMFHTHGHNFNQFGIAFEYDLHGLAHAHPKIIEREQDAWFGKFTWPTKEYPRFSALQATEDLVDNNSPLLKEAFKYITKASELGLCITSGHGWLEGPDISDLALLNQRASKGSRIFGKTFQGEDIWHTFGRNEYFKWAQQNTLNAVTRHLLDTASPPKQVATEELRFIDNFVIREMDSFTVQHDQPDFDITAHVGGAPSNQQNNPAHFIPPVNNQQGHANAVLSLQTLARNAQFPRTRGRTARSTRPSDEVQTGQWPLIFNGFNVAAEVGGLSGFVQSQTGNPKSSQLRPGSLTEAQAQWLMETLWAQRAFLSAYTTAIITNRPNFANIHTFRISKLSSGLLPSLEQNEFWSSLPGLRKLEILISPDWRQEHTTGDRAFQKSMAIPPHKAAQRFTEFLRSFVVPLERLHSLTVGYSDGGEHAVGMFARNQHVLPAPIVENPADWLTTTPRPGKTSNITKFDHIRDLNFENCWLSPRMLREFMHQSCDTSLHSLTLDSVSLLTSHDPSIDQPQTTIFNNLQCQYPRDMWAREIIPTGATWTQTLDAITPGVTLIEHKYKMGLIDEKIQPKEERSFRGHVQQIHLNSCGYVKITLPSNIKATTFHQLSAVTHAIPPSDSGIKYRKDYFFAGRALGSGLTDSIWRFEDEPRSAANVSRWTNEIDSENASFMMSKLGPKGVPYPWLGTLTQCVHPIEQRVLEEAWGIKFGWGDTLDRWAAVEDGFYEGGTGRFSGTLQR